MFGEIIPYSRNTFLFPLTHPSNNQKQTYVIKSHNPILKLCCVWVAKVRRDGPHASPQQREKPAGDLPCGCRIYEGVPSTGNPFLQVYLPGGFRYSNRKSRAVCYNVAGATAETAKATTRTRVQALASVQTWAWQWWNSLTQAERDALENLNIRHAEPAQKRQKRE